jgi:hypothetical protein
MARSLITHPEGYDEFLRNLKQRIRTAQVRAVFAVNRELVLLYWQIGRGILERQREAGWGAKVIDGAVTGQAPLVPGHFRPLETLELFEGGEFLRSSDGTLQERSETRNDVADKLTQLMERWKDSIGLTNRRLDVIIRFRVADSGEEWCER